MKTKTKQDGALSGHGDGTSTCDGARAMRGFLVPQCLMDLDGFVRGVHLFNQAEFFEAHEVLEDVWRAAPVAEKKFLQGIIQVAVALHHHSHGNRVGAQSLMKRALRNLSGYPRDFGGIDLDGLLRGVSRWQEAMASSTTLPLPRIETYDR